MPTALPLSEYFVAHLAADIDISHADGKARFVAEARPLLERVPAGAYRELLLDRLAAAIGVSAERFLSIVGPMNTPQGASTPRTGSASRPHRAQHRTRRPGAPGRAEPAAFSGHRGPPFRPRTGEALDAVDEPGIEVLRELLDALQEQPALHTAQLLERWRDQPLGERLARLAAERSLLARRKGRRRRDGHSRAEAGAGHGRAPNWTR